MDPASIIGITSATVSITTRLIPTILGIKELWDGVNNIDDSNMGFVEELDAFHFSISLIDAELRKADSDIETSDWWSGSRLTDLLTNAMKTMGRVEVILQDIARKRRFMPSVRSYYRSTMYDKELGHLLLRLKTYTSALSLPTSIIAQRTVHQVSGPSNVEQPAVVDTSALKLEESVSATDEAIAKVLKDIPTLCVELDGRENMAQPHKLVMDSEELVEIAGSVVATMTTVSSAGPVPRRRSHRPSELPTKEDWESVSLSGVPLSSQSTYRIQAWYDTVRSSGFHSSIPESTGTALLGNDSFNVETQLIKHRFELAQRLCMAEKYSDGIPYLRKTLGSFPEATEARQDLQEIRQDAQLLLAKALMEVKPISTDAETLLSELGDMTSYAYHDEALHLLVSAQKELHPTDLERAKRSCMRTIQTKTRLYGQRHEQTQDSVHSMIQLCELTGDTDTAVWQRLLVWPRRAKIDINEHHRQVNILDAQINQLKSKLQDAKERETALIESGRTEIARVEQSQRLKEDNYSFRIGLLEGQKAKLIADLEEAREKMEANRQALEETRNNHCLEVQALVDRIKAEERQRNQIQGHEEYSIRDTKSEPSGERSYPQSRPIAMKLMHLVRPSPPGKTREDELQDAMDKVRECAYSTLGSSALSRLFGTKEAAEAITTLELMALLVREYQLTRFGRTDIQFDPSTRRIGYMAFALNSA